jgi:hypothetical protein
MEWLLVAFVVRGRWIVSEQFADIPCTVSQDETTECRCWPKFYFSISLLLAPRIGFGTAIHINQKPYHFYPENGTALKMNELKSY